jgi:branched-chain amino acid transport system permease protein
VLGVILIFFVLLVPKGVAPTMTDWFTKRRKPAHNSRRRRKKGRNT